MELFLYVPMVHSEEQLLSIVRMRLLGHVEHSVGIGPLHVEQVSWHLIQVEF